jgi:hypothetical protein
MKALFPCEGSIIVNKQDLDPMTAYYNMQLMRSNMNEYIKTANAILQVGNFSYIPESSHFVVNMENLSTIGQIKTALNIEVPQTTNVQTGAPQGAVQANNATQQKANEEWLNKPITDEDISSNPFFTTMKEA